MFTWSPDFLASNRWFRNKISCCRLNLLGKTQLIVSEQAAELIIFSFKLLLKQDQSKEWTTKGQAMALRINILGTTDSC